MGAGTEVTTPGGYWLAGVDRQKVAQLQAVNRGARDLAGHVAAHIARAEPYFWAASIRTPSWRQGRRWANLLSRDSAAHAFASAPPSVSSRKLKMPSHPHYVMLPEPTHP